MLIVVRSKLAFIFKTRTHRGTKGNERSNNAKWERQMALWMMGGTFTRQKQRKWRTRTRELLTATHYRWRLTSHTFRRLCISTLCRKCCTIIVHYSHNALWFTMSKPDYLKYDILYDAYYKHYTFNTFLLLFIKNHTSLVVCSCY